MAENNTAKTATDNKVQTMNMNMKPNERSLSRLCDVK